MKLSLILDAEIYQQYGGYYQALRQWSPYLAECHTKEKSWLEQHCDSTIDKIVQDILDNTNVSNLRQGKRRLSLLLALYDLSGYATLEYVTQNLSKFAYCAIDIAYHTAFQAIMPNDICASPEESGFIILAMGKLGAYELNYSSDIDLIFLYDTDRYNLAHVSLTALKKYFLLIGRKIISILSDITSEGYVFRTDLDLRPNPSSTPICVSTLSAQQYYESYGRTWERAAFIKAQVCPTADQKAGTNFLAYLHPFIWRKHLDHTAIEDAYSIISRIRTHRKSLHTQNQGINVKLDRGGIREIEFFVQTHQLIWGGRYPDLRIRATCEMLNTLSNNAFIDNQSAEELKKAYIFLRKVEHCAQMILNAQTHVVGHDHEHQNILASMMAFKGREQFNSALCSTRTSVQNITEKLYVQKESPHNIETILQNYTNPQQAEETVNNWLSASMPVTRSARAKRTLKRLLPTLLATLQQQTNNPDTALQQIDKILQKLPAGTQVFSLFEAEPVLLKTIIHVSTTAPYLTEQLIQYPILFDFFLRMYRFPVDKNFRNDLIAQLEKIDTYEKKLDFMRCFAREQRFSIALQALLNVIPARTAAILFSRIAQDIVDITFELVCTTYNYDINSFAVVAMGRLGSQEMTYTSDLDLIVIYATDTDPTESLRCTRRFISALTVQTAEGKLYEVDMQLRPSGRAGPVAVRIDAFEQYQYNAAWTWELLALTRARCISGCASMMTKVDFVIMQAVTSVKDNHKVRRDTHEMYLKLNNDANASWKTCIGGMTMMEFCIQAMCLMHGIKEKTCIKTLNKLVALNIVPSVFIKIHQDYEEYLQITRLITGETVSPQKLNTMQRSVDTLLPVLDNMETNYKIVNLFYEEHILRNKTTCNQNSI